MHTFSINGFGRIGRTALKAWWANHTAELDLKVINTSGSMEIENWAHLLKYDTNYGLFKGNITTSRQQSKDQVNDQNQVLGTITLNDQTKTKTIAVIAQRDPSKIKWLDYQIETVIEATGIFVTEEKAAQHFVGGAKFVIISAPAKGGNVSSSVLGVNTFSSESKVLSNESCTTNCVAPVVKIMHQNFKVLKSIMTTIHSYTDDQNLHDNSHKDLRRARAAGNNIIPTSTGAAIATTRVIPDLENKFDGTALRVPTAVGSISDIVFLIENTTTVEAVNQAFITASQQPEWKNILAVTDEPLVSSDIIGRIHSSIVDLNLTKVVDGNLVQVFSWYDNEWGYCNRLIEQLLHLPA